jgi:hypothetical protein
MTLNNNTISLMVIDRIAYFQILCNIRDMEKEKKKKNIYYTQLTWEN